MIFFFKLQPALELIIIVIIGKKENLRSSAGLERGEAPQGHEGHSRVLLWHRWRWLLTKKERVLETGTAWSEKKPQRVFQDPALPTVGGLGPFRSSSHTLLFLPQTHPGCPARVPSQNGAVGAGCGSPKRGKRGLFPGSSFGVSPAGSEQGRGPENGPGCGSEEEEEELSLHFSNFGVQTSTPFISGKAQRESPPGIAPLHQSLQGNGAFFPARARGERPHPVLPTLDIPPAFSCSPCPGRSSSRAESTGQALGRCQNPSGKPLERN